MKNGYSILTRRMQGIDVHVWLIFLFVIAVSGAVLLIKITSANVNKVIDVLVIDETGSSSSNFYPKEILRFSTKAKGSVVWDFGDGVSLKGNNVSHSFTYDGKQYITITVNGKIKRDTITIHKDPVVTEDPTDLDPIYGTAEVPVGKKAIFLYNGKSNVSSFEWTIENNPTYPLQTSNKAYYTFNSAGTVTVLLELNHDPLKIFSHKVTVIATQEKLSKPLTGHRQRNHNSGSPEVIIEDDPTSNTAPASVVTNTSEAPVVQQNETQVQHAAIPCSDCDVTFKKMFEEVERIRYDQQDWDSYFCKGMSPPMVTVNGHEMSLKSACDLLIKSNGKIKITTVHVSKNFQQCIIHISIDYKTGLLSKIGL